MNIYFLVEGKRTEFKVYPRWLSFLLPKIKRVNRPDEVVQNNFFIFNGGGYPCMLNHLKNSIEEVNDSGIFDFLVVCLDSDGNGVQEKREEIFSFIQKENIILTNRTKLVVIVQNICIETWFLGNTKIFKANPNNTELSEKIKFYNVKKDDPELMTKPSNFEGTEAAYHLSYLKELLRERKIDYTKTNPRGVVEKDFLNNLISRNKKTNHINSFKDLLDFCDQVNNLIP